MEHLICPKLNSLTTIGWNSIKSIRSYGEEEFIGGKLKKWFQEKGITHEITIAHSSESNGVAERLNRTLLNIARPMLLKISE